MACHGLVTQLSKNIWGILVFFYAYPSNMFGCAAAIVTSDRMLRKDLKLWWEFGILRNVEIVVRKV